jgi:hypothetical protein
MHSGRLLRVAMVAILATTIVPLTSCGGGSAAPRGEKLKTWPLDTVSAIHAPVSAAQGGKLTLTTAGVTAEVSFPPGAFAEDTEIEFLPFTTSPVKDGTENLADGVFIRRMGDGVMAPPTLAKPAELRLTVAKAAPGTSSIVRWSLSKGTAEPLKTAVTPQGTRTTLSTSLTTLGGFGARAPKP